MTMIVPNMSCPDSGDFYACDGDGFFVGCCETNPCTNAGCPSVDLTPTSFDVSQYGSLDNQYCGNGDFYQCSGADPPFWGCCMISPCDDGCSDDALVPAYLSGVVATNQYLQLNDTFVGSQSSSSESLSAELSTATVMATSISTVFATAAAETSTSTSETSSTSETFSTSETSSVPTTSSISASSSRSTSSPPTSSIHSSSLPIPTPGATSTPASHSNTAAIAGGVAGGGILVLAALILIFFLLRRKRKSKRTQPYLPDIQEPYDEKKMASQSSKEELSGKSPPCHDIHSLTDLMSYIADTSSSSSIGYYSPLSPMVPSSFAVSPLSPSSPGIMAPALRPMSFELPGTASYELDSGQHYHPYRPEAISHEGQATAGSEKGV